MRADDLLSQRPPPVSESIVAGPGPADDRALLHGGIVSRALSAAAATAAGDIDTVSS